MKPLSILLAALTLLSAAPAANAELLASDDDSGTLPWALTSADRDDPRQGARVEVKAWPAEPVEVTASMHCNRGSHSRSKDGDFPSAPSPVNRRVALTMKNPDDCWVSASASYVDAELAGRILLKIFW